MELRGEYGSAKVFTTNLQEGARDQIINLLDQDFLEGSTVRIMPDVHQGMGCVIGFTADMGEKESQFAYKPIEDIINSIYDTIDIIDIIKPIYNYKA